MLRHLEEPLLQNPGEYSTEPSDDELKSKRPATRKTTLTLAFRAEDPNFRNSNVLKGAAL
jgi:hypothetical protein